MFLTLPTRLSLLALLLVLCVIASPAAAGAAPFDPHGFHFTSARLYVDENAGDAVITVERTDTRRLGIIRAISLQGSAQSPYDFKQGRYEIVFQPGQATGTFEIPIVDHGIDSAPVNLHIGLYGPYPIGMGTPSQAVLTILNNDPVAPADPQDPLGLPDASTSANPLVGAKFYVNPFSDPARWVWKYPLLKAIADEPGAGRFGTFSWPNVQVSVQRYLAQASYLQPGTIPMLTTYRLVDGHCDHWTPTAADQRSYHNFIVDFAQGIGTYRAVLFLEQDSLITVGCLSPEGVSIRMHELRDAINILLADCPHIVIYLDAGAADAIPAPETARLLLRAGVQKIQGFFLNATHFDWTLNEIHYGDAISRLIGGKHFTVTTGGNGQGPLVPQNRAKQGNEVLCNPPGRGLGPKPTWNTGFPLVDAFEWIDNPGGSSGQCLPGEPPKGVYWPQWAVLVVKHADYAVR